MRTIPIYIIILLLFSSTDLYAQWTTSKDVDEMTGEGNSYAHSPSVNPTERMGSPYSDVRAWLGVGCDGDSEWSYIGFSQSPNITDDETEDGYNVITTRVKWNDSIKNEEFTQDWGANFLHFRRDDVVIKDIMSSSTALVELNWYGEGRTFFRFSLAGSSAAVQKIRRECSSYK